MWFLLLLFRCSAYSYLCFYFHFHSHSMSVVLVIAAVCCCCCFVSGVEIRSLRLRMRRLARAKMLMNINATGWVFVAAHWVCNWAKGVSSTSPPIRCAVINRFVFPPSLTLYGPRSCTTQVRKASRPTGAVTFAIGELNLGSTGIESGWECIYRAIVSLIIVWNQS